MKLMPPQYNEIIKIAASYGFTLDKLLPLVVVSFFLYLAIRGTVKKVDDRVKDVEDCIIEIQTFVKNRFPKAILERTISQYGHANSPVILKEQFLPFITDVGLDKQIEDKKEGLIKWLKEQNPKTGIDAQEDIFNFVVSKEIDKYLDLIDYKQNLYIKGKTSNDVEAILGIYLFGILIPELFPEKKK